MAPVIIELFQITQVLPILRPLHHGFIVLHEYLLDGCIQEASCFAANVLTWYKNPTAPKIRTICNAASIGIFIPPAWAAGLQEKYHKSDGQGFSTTWIPQNHLSILDDANPEHDNQLLMQPH